MPMKRFQIKRLFDLLLACLAAVLLLLPAGLVALLVKLSSPGPVLYWSDRVGRGNRIFSMPKFRSMRVGTPAVATHLLTDPQACLTPVGSFLRKSSLDELPQLWNVIRGEMSLVGPRPIVASEVERYADAFDEYTRVLPGITGLWQVSGRSDTTYAQRVQLDTYYTHNWSPWLDLYLILRTFGVLVSGRGAY